jgi:hypothetical protein
MISSLGSREDSLRGLTGEAVWRQPSCISHATNRRSDVIVLTYRFRTRMNSLWTQSQPARLGVGSLHSVALKDQCDPLSYSDAHGAECVTALGTL